MPLALPGQYQEAARQDLIKKFAAKGVDAAALADAPKQALEAIAAVLMPDAKPARPADEQLQPQDDEERSVAGQARTFSERQPGQFRQAPAQAVLAFRAARRVQLGLTAAEYMGRTRR